MSPGFLLFPLNLLLVEPRARRLTIHTTRPDESGPRKRRRSSSRAPEGVKRPVPDRMETEDSRSRREMRGRSNRDYREWPKTGLTCRGRSASRASSRVCVHRDSDEHHSHGRPGRRLSRGAGSSTCCMTPSRRSPWLPIGRLSPAVSISLRAVRRMTTVKWSSTLYSMSKPWILTLGVEMTPTSLTFMSPSNGDIHEQCVFVGTSRCQ